jgi:hypothetical protein
LCLSVHFETNINLNIERSSKNSVCCLKEKIFKKMSVFCV